MPCGKLISELLALRESRVVAIRARRHFVIAVESEVKAAVCAAVATLARLLAGANFSSSSHWEILLFVGSIGLFSYFGLIYAPITGFCRRLD